MGAETSGWGTLLFEAHNLVSILLELQDFGWHLFDHFNLKGNYVKIIVAVLTKGIFRIV